MNSKRVFEKAMIGAGVFLVVLLIFKAVVIYTHHYPQHVNASVVLNNLNHSAIFVCVTSVIFGSALTVRWKYTDLAVVSLAALIRALMFWHGTTLSFPGIPKPSAAQLFESWGPMYFDLPVAAIITTILLKVFYGHKLSLARQV